MASNNKSESRLSTLRQHFPPSSFPSLATPQSRISLQSHELRSIILAPNLNYFDRILSHISASPVFNHHLELDQPRNALRSLGFTQIIDLYPKFKLSIQQDTQDLLIKYTFAYALAFYSISQYVRLMVSLGMYCDSIYFLGTEKHMNYIQRAYDLQDFGSFSMTELGHGSNVAVLETTATFDKATREFVINSPTPTSAKVWIGAVGNTANMTVLYAQLIIDGKSQGVHTFVVPIRDHATHNPLPGVICGDMGAKAGNDVIDNGFLLFNNYRVPYDSLLDRLSWITPEGKFESSVQNPAKRFGLTVSGVTGARMLIPAMSAINLFKSQAIAIRYLSRRTQFNSIVMEYPLQKYKLMPQLVKSVVLLFAARLQAELYSGFVEAVKKDPDAKEGSEYHALLSIYKPLSGWYAMEGVQKAREACGGMGYSAFNMIGHFLQQTDTNMTWDGENDVLSQQCARFILKQYQRKIEGEEVETRYLDILEVEEIQRSAKFVKAEDLREEEIVKMMVDRLNLNLMRSTSTMQENIGQYGNFTEVWNASLVFNLKELAISFGELTVLRVMYEQARTLLDENNRKLIQLYANLYGLDCIERSAKYLLDYFTFPQLDIIRSEIIRLCDEVQLTALDFIEAMNIPEKCFGSVIGDLNRNPYDSLVGAIENGQGCYEQPKWHDKIKLAKNKQIGHSYYFQAIR